MTTLTFTVGTVLQDECHLLYQEADSESQQDACYIKLYELGAKKAKPNSPVRLTLTMEEAHEFISRADYYASFSPDEYRYDSGLEKVVKSYQGIIGQLHRKGFKWDSSALRIAPIG